MAKFASSLSDSYEYLLIWGGQSLSRPWGTQADGFSVAPELQLDATGVELPGNGSTTGIVLDANNNSGTGKTITVLGTTLSAQAWIGAQLRLYDPTGTATSKPLGGYATVTANGSNQLTVDWGVAASATGTVAGYLVRTDGKWASFPEVRVLTPYQPEGPNNPRAVTFTDAGDLVTLVAHGLTTGSTVVFRAITSTTGITVGTTYYVIRTAADNFKLAATLADALVGTAIALTTNGSGMMDDAPSQTVPYPTPGTGEKLAAPGYTVPASITSFADLGVFLPYTYYEGIEGHGISEVTDSYLSPQTHAVNAGTDASNFKVADQGNLIVTNCLAGGFIRVQWVATGVAKLSWARIATNSSALNVCTMVLSGAWQGDGVPDPAASPKFECWVPHYLNNPHSYLPGKGFRYPNQDMQPCFAGDGRITNRPRGITTKSYPYKFDAMLKWAWSVALAVGKRVNVIALGVNSSGQYWENSYLGFGFNGTIGWYDYLNVRDWTPGATTGLSARLKKLITTIAPAALTAEGNAKQPKVLAISFLQGEGDALNKGGRQRFNESLATFKRWLRKTITDAGMSPYTGEATIPFVNEKVMETPYMLTGPQPYYGTTLTLDGDVDGLVNDAIVRNQVPDPYADFITIDDLPRLSLDLGHLSGAGAATQGNRLADATIPLIERALSVGSPVLTSQPTDVVDLCNLALSNLGDTAQITAIDGTDTSAQAVHCARYYPMARDAVLAMRPWTFAAKRVALDAITSDRPEWDFAYALPGDLMVATAVTASDATDDNVQSNVSPAWPTGSFTDLAITPTTQDYVIEMGADGNRILYTDQEDATLRYQARVTDASQFPPLFKQALGWQLSAMLAGPLLKGDAGAAEAKRCAAMAAAYMGEAATVDANQRQTKPLQRAPWISGR